MFHYHQQQSGPESGHFHTLGGITWSSRPLYNTGWWPAGLHSLGYFQLYLMFEVCFVCMQGSHNLPMSLHLISSFSQFWDVWDGLLFLVRFYANVNIQSPAPKDSILSSVCVFSSGEAGGTEIPCKNLAAGHFSMDALLPATGAFPELAGNPRL